MGQTAGWKILKSTELKQQKKGRLLEILKVEEDVICSFNWL